ncbi:MAG: sulfatase-like hydrolase/transferase, partial [Pirellulales bacterium]|nr:sulfatase-like hydrolase/transferase [Pirellulales bacterium]
MKCFFHHAALGLLLVSWATASERQVGAEHRHGATAGRPNILWIVAEDMGPELSRHQIPELHTPTLDRLAQQGMEYRNTFTVTPVCSTSRS